MAAALTAIERIARVLAGRASSANAAGTRQSAGNEVEDHWRDYTADALAILKVLREPDPVMAAAGNAGVWQAMVEAAIAAEERALDAHF